VIKKKGVRSECPKGDGVKRGKRVRKFFGHARLPSTPGLGLAHARALKGGLTAEDGLGLPRQAHTLDPGPQAYVVKESF